MFEFRGKRIDNGLWVYGSLIKQGKHRFIAEDKYGFFYSSKTTDIKCDDTYDVLPDSVGMFTGLKDKGGVCLDWWEGSIVTFEHDQEQYTDVGIAGSQHKSQDVFFNPSVICFEQGTFVLKCKGKSLACHYVLSKFGFISKDIKVIGNVTDSPGLLEKQ